MIREDKSRTICSDVAVSDDAIIPGKSSWGEFLANRNNKASLVGYLCQKIKEEDCSLLENEKLFVSCEGNVFRVTRKGTVESEELRNNHVESDTRMYFLMANSNIRKPVWIIRSTDTDILFIALLNHDQLSLGTRTVYIHYNKNGESPKYCCINDLVKCINQDTSFSLLATRTLSAAKCIGLMHFFSACDDFSLVRGFTKNLCLKAFEKFNSVICPESADTTKHLFSGDETTTIDFMIRYISCLYFYTCRSRGMIYSRRLSNQVKHPR